MSTYHVAIIGSGSGGSRAAILAAKKGAKVILIEKKQIGGVCLHNGCIPVKSLAASERMLRQAQNCGKYGIRIDRIEAHPVDWVNRQRHAVAKLTEQLVEELMRTNVEIRRGHAKLLGQGKIRITSGAHEEVIEAHKIIIATGAKPYVPEELQGRRSVYNSEQFISVTELPRTLAIIGGGYIGCEFASIYSALGSKVYLIERRGHLVPRSDPEVGDFLQTRFESLGIEVFTGSEATIKPESSNISGEPGSIVALRDQGEIFAENVLIAAGRVPNVDNLGLELAGIHMTETGIAVDRKLQTSVPDVYAIGDVNGITPLAHAAFAQAEVAVAHAFGHNIDFDPARVPHCVYTDPEVATVGLREVDARAAGYEVAVNRFNFRTVARAVASGETEGFIKLVADARTHQFLGGIVINNFASELIGELCMALQLGITAEQFAAITFPHPSFTEGLQECARGLFSK